MGATIAMMIAPTLFLYRPKDYSSTAAWAAANQDLFRLIISYLRKSKVNISYAVLARSANSAS